MDRWEALYQFWSSFGVPAYEENSVPDLDQVTFPYITYEAKVGGWEEPVACTASIWDESYSWAAADRLSDTIESAIRLSDPVAYNGGMYRVWIGDTPFSQNMGDPDNDKIKRKVLNVNFEFMQIKL